MLTASDRVRNKMEKGDGMSFSEFTYPLLQAWDWWHMYSNMEVQVQIGGSDQYGNIVAGMDAVKYIAQSSEEIRWLDGDGRMKEELLPMGLTVPLLTTSSGEKFGKSAGNAVWLDKNMTSTFDLYGVSVTDSPAPYYAEADANAVVQFLLRSSDEDVERYLKLFTFVPSEEINATLAQHANDPGKRSAQHLLASEVLELVHGREEAEKTRAEHLALRSPTLSSLAQKSNVALNDETDSTEGTQRTVLPSSLVLNTPFSRILYHAGIVATKSEGARLIAKGGAYIASGQGGPGDSEDLAFAQILDQKPDQVRDYVMGGLLIFRVGKWKVRVVEVVEDADFDARGLDVPGWQEWKANANSRRP